MANHAEITVQHENRAVADPGVIRADQQSDPQTPQIDPALSGGTVRDSGLEADEWGELEVLPPQPMTHIENAQKQARFIVEMLTEQPKPRWRIALAMAKALEKVLAKAQTEARVVGQASPRRRPGNLS